MTVLEATGFSTVDPSTGEPIERFDYHSDTQLDVVLARAESAHARWRTTSIEHRIEGIRRLASILAGRREALATQIVREMGKPFAQALGEIDKCIATCQHYADNVAAFLEPRRVDVGEDAASVHLRPLGVVLAVLPWNYPWWQVVRAMLPAIALGDTVVLKHAESVTGCAVTVERVLAEAFGEDVLVLAIASGAQAGAMIEDPRIAAVTFTGSERVGAIVAQTAGRVLKKCVLELGGSDPFIVLEDADVAAAAQAAVRSRFLNNGQSCIAAKRIVVQRSIRDDLVDAMRAHVAALRVGDPFDPETEVGPIARQDLAETLREQRARAAAGGDAVLVGGPDPDRPGSWFAPTLMSASDRTSPLLAEETFGPLAAVTAVDGVDDAIRVANDTQYGLSSALWTADVERAHELAARIQAGSVFVNAISMSDPRLPVGGVKASGYGRELSDYGIAEFANVQAVRVGA
ncbi:NAD-dependent succinate-semialdehyde dehydrogenase [Agrococcus versicolor]|uniref:NAD-dependent succinate-semialdehyde dehydrogenase n=1 Tax=Agrococcus versicolor TaxID=501482 RepID=A0ABP5MMQ1_9MICO